ncbi:hypothetical protein, partial [Nostoc sp. S13]|uniref:hypothetical protein n=1 Tax=Nostoc sp. S13 TaxID=3019266 RepID=UPI00261B417C
MMRLLSKAIAPTGYTVAFLTRQLVLKGATSEFRRGMVKLLSRAIALTGYAVALLTRQLVLKGATSEFRRG